MKIKEKGFTLVELLTVFVILSIILGMVVINVNNYSSKQREKDYENLVKIIEENAKVLVNKNEDLFVGVTNYASSKVIDVNGNTLNGCKFSYDLLVDNKLMDKDTVNPVDNKAFYDSNYSIIATLSDKGTYNYELKQNVNDDYTNCLDIDNVSIKNMNLSLTSTSNSVTAKVTIANTLDFVRRVDWVLYDEDDNKLKEVSSENLIYNFGGLKSNKLYKVRAKLVSVTNKYQEKIDKANTLPILNPYITITNNPTTLQNGYLYSQNINVTYNGGGVISPTYYLKSTKNGNIDSSLNISCGTGSMPSNCTETQSTTILSENMWYKVPKNISISYDNENDKIGTIYAVTFDGDNYSSAITATLDKIDRTPPTCSWNGESTSWTKENRTITATCNDSKSGCTSGTASKNWSYTNGTHKSETLSYTMSDNVGNTVTCRKDVNIYVDKEAPTIKYTQGLSGSGGYDLTFTSTDSGEMQSIIMSGDSSASGTSTLSIKSLKTGTYTIISKDKAGNTSKKIVRILTLAYPNYRYGNWGTNWYNCWFGEILNTKYEYSNVMYMSGVPDSTQGRILSWYTQSISLANYDKISVLYYIADSTTSNVYFQVGIGTSVDQCKNLSILNQKQASTKSSEGGLYLEGDISKDNSSKSILYIINGGSETTVNSYILTTGMISVRDN